MRRVAAPAQGDGTLDGSDRSFGLLHGEEDLGFECARVRQTRETVSARVSTCSSATFSWLDSASSWISLSLTPRLRSSRLVRLGLVAELVEALEGAGRVLLVAELSVRQRELVEGRPESVGARRARFR